MRTIATNTNGLFCTLLSRNILLVFLSSGWIFNCTELIRDEHRRICSRLFCDVKEKVTAVTLSAVTLSDVVTLFAVTVPAHFSCEIFLSGADLELFLILWCWSWIISPLVVLILNYFSSCGADLELFLILWCWSWIISHLVVLILNYFSSCYNNYVLVKFYNYINMYLLNSISIVQYIYYFKTLNVTIIGCLLVNNYVINDELYVAILTCCMSIRRHTDIVYFTRNWHCIC